jgi:hypothetical protein
VRLLVPADDLREVAQLTGEGGTRQCLLVERGLQPLEDESEVEDLPILLGRRCSSCRRLGRAAHARDQKGRGAQRTQPDDIATRPVARRCRCVAA